MVRARVIETSPDTVRFAPESGPEIAAPRENIDSRFDLDDLCVEHRTVWIRIDERIRVDRLA